MKSKRYSDYNYYLTNEDQQIKVEILNELNESAEQIVMDEFDDSESDIELTIHSYEEDIFSSFPCDKLNIKYDSNEENSPPNSNIKKLDSVSSPTPKMDTKIELRNRQKLNLLTYFLDICLTKEIELMAKKPSIFHHEDKPFLQFVINNIIRPFPWISKESAQKFWHNIDNFMNLLNKLKLSSSKERGERSYASRSYFHIRKGIVILFKNILRSPFSRQQLKEEQEMETEIAQYELNPKLQTLNLRTDLHRSIGENSNNNINDSENNNNNNNNNNNINNNNNNNFKSNSCNNIDKYQNNNVKISENVQLLLDTVLVENYKEEEIKEIKTTNCKKKKFHVEIVATRNLFDRFTSSSYEEYIVEAKYGNQNGRTAHRYSNFEIFHNTIKQNFESVKLPMLPSKKPFQKHTQEFVEIRKRELSSYLKKICSIPEIRNSAEIVAFLLPGISVTLTEKEKKLLNERKHLDLQMELKLVEFKSLILSLFQESQGFDQLKLLFPALQKALSIADLPPDFITLINYSRSIFSYYLYHIFHRDLKCEKNLNLIKKIYLLTPFTALKSILSVSNPSKILNGIVNQFLAKPLNSRNLLQSFVAEVYLQDASLSVEALKAVRNSVSNSNVTKKVHNFVKSNKKLPQSNISVYEKAELILSCPSVQPIIPLNTIHSILLQKDAPRKILKLYKIELRQLDLKKVIEFYGNERVIAILKDVLLALLQPIISLINEKDLSDFLVNIKDILSHTIGIAENRSASPSILYQKYTEIIAKIEGLLFDFFHKASLNDQNHYLENIINWLLKILDIARKDNLDKKYPVDMNLLLNHFHSDYENSRFIRDMKKLDEFAYDKAQEKSLKANKVSEYIKSCKGSAASNYSSGSDIEHNVYSQQFDSNGSRRDNSDDISGYHSSTVYTESIELELRSGVESADVDQLLSITDSIFDILKKKHRDPPSLSFIPSLRDHFLSIVSDTLFSNYEK